jgi:hypothetical protein
MLTLKYLEDLFTRVKLLRSTTDRYDATYYWSR